MGIEKDDVDEKIERLVALGVLIEHLDESTGEMYYEVSPEAYKIVPALWEAHVKDMGEKMRALWMADMIDYQISEHGHAEDMITLTDNAFDEAKVNALPDMERNCLIHLREVFQKRFGA